MQSIQIKQILFLILILFVFLVIFGFLIYTSTANAKINEESIPGKRKLISYENSDITIDSDEVIDGDIIIKNGTITIAGKIHGNIIAFNTEVVLESSASIFGNIVSYKKEVIREEQARVAGDIVSWIDEEIQISREHNLAGYDFKLTLYENDALIEKDQTVYGDLLVLNSDMTVDGKVDGNIINLFGETRVNKAGAVDGNVIGYEGRITVEEEALVTGRTLTVVAEEKHAKRGKSDEDDHELRERVERKYLKRDQKKNSDIFRFWGDIAIEPDEFIRGDVVTLRGTIRVQGEVDGDVVAVFGSVNLDSTAHVNGDVVSVGGKIYRDKNAVVGGDIVQTSITGVKVDEGDQHVSVGLGGVSIRPKKDDDWEQERRRPRKNWNDNYDVLDDNSAMLFRYNRVEGLFLGFRIPREEWSEKTSALFDLYGHAGYGFSRKHACYQIGVERSILGRFGPVIGVEAHDITTSQDEWIIPTFENSLAALFLREDFQDYYRREGYSAYVSHDISEYLKLTGEFRQEQHFDMKRKTNWSIFGGDKKFRANPLIDPIEFRSLVARLSFDTRNYYKYPDQGWLINLMGEFAGEDFNKNGVDFDRFIVDIRRYQPIVSGENLDFRLRAGSSRGVLPAHLKFDVGGLSTIRGYRFKEFENHNRMLLGNLEYRIYGRRNPLRHTVGGDLGLILFADAGYVWTVPDSLKAQKGFDDLDWKDLYTSIGFGLSNREGNVRLEFAKRLDEKDQPMVVTFRINRPF